MENFDGNQGEKRTGFFFRISKTLKAFIIGFLVLLLLIPMGMIEGLINERRYTGDDAIREVSQKWSGSQILTGPYLTFDYYVYKPKKDKNDVEYDLRLLTLLPDELTIDGKLQTETRKRGIYEVNVYQSTIELTGSFSADELKKAGVVIDNIDFSKARLSLGLSDMRGISEQIKVHWGDSVYLFESGLSNIKLGEAGVNTMINASTIKDITIPYKIEIKLKGSQSMFFTPIGKTTKVNLEANWNTPSFDGNYLPETHTITDSGFTAKWQVLNLNRSYSQTFFGSDNVSSIDRSTFGVNLKVPVEQYQQSMRTAKYAILIILLTFVVVFFVETMDKKPIHALQYLLIGLALCLFYTLLVSMSEQMNFGLAYLIAAVMTVSLISFYIKGIMKKNKPAMIIGLLLTVLYVYIYILIQLETLALLAGSLGLFIILALLMYFSKKIDWFSEQ